MKIAINTLVTPSTKIGVGEYLRNLIIRLQEIDRENLYFIFTADDTRHLFPITADNFHEIRSGVLQNHGLFSTIATIYWLHTRFLRSCHRLDIDIVHVPNTQLMLWRNPPTIVTLHDLGEWHIRRHHAVRAFYRKSANYLQARLSRSIITVSKNSRNDICNFLNISNEKVSVTYEGAADRFHMPVSCTDARLMVRCVYGIDGDFVLCIGSHKKHKNIEGVLRAVAKIKSEHGLPFKLVLVGKPDNARSGINRAVSQLELKTDVLLTGYVPDDHLPYLYRAAKIFVFPSLWEGFGIPVVEAMACGCPVICSNRASLPEVAGEAALFVDPGNISEIAEAIMEILRNPEKEQRLRAAGPLQAKKFSHHKMAEQTLDVYKKAYNVTKEAVK